MWGRLGGLGPRGDRNHYSLKFSPPLSQILSLSLSLSLSHNIYNFFFLLL